MKKILLTALFFGLIQIANAQIRAITDTGDVVLLYSDGTYEYLEDHHFGEDGSMEIVENEEEFERSESSDFLLKSSTLNMGVYLDPKKWKFQKSKGLDDYEYEIEMRGEDLYGGLITEKISIPLEALADIAFQNFRDAAIDAKIDKIEYRTVNGLRLLYLRMDGTIQGIKVTYNGYYYSNDNGTVQFVVFTGQNLVVHYGKEIDTILNGLVEI